MKENRREEGLLVRAEPLQWAQENSQRMVNVVRVEDGSLLLEVDSQVGRGYQHGAGYEGCEGRDSQGDWQSG